MKRTETLKSILGAAALASLLSAPVAYAAGSSSGSNTGQSANTSQTAQRGSSGSDSETAKSSLSQSDQRLMRELAQANIAEISTAKLALEKSKNDQVRSFAQKMVDDHTQAGNQLQQLAQQNGVTLPTEADAKHRAEMKKLQALSEQQFDKQYMQRAGLQDHKSTHNLLSRIATRAQNQELKQLASNMMPTVDSHLATARKDAGGRTGMGTSTSQGSDTGQNGTSRSQGGSSGATSNSQQGAGTGQ